MTRSAIAVCAVGLVVVGSSSSASPSLRPVQPIAFAQEDSCLCGRSEIAIVRPGGSGLRRLTHDSAAESQPAWSADHKTIAFVRGGFAAGPERIWLTDARASHVRPLSRSIPRAERQFAPSWSPDVARIAVSARTGGEFVLSIVDVRTGRERTIPTRGLGQIESPTWSRAGKKLAFDATRGGGIQIFVISLGTGRWGQVTRCREDGCWSPDWSPNGRSIVFVDAHTGAIEAVDLRNGSVRTLVKGPKYRISDPSWSPDGRWLSYDAKGEVWLVPAAGGTAHRVTRARPGVVNANPDW